MATFWRGSCHSGRSVARGKWILLNRFCHGFVPLAGWHFGTMGARRAPTPFGRTYGRSDSPRRSSRWKQAGGAGTRRALRAHAISILLQWYVFPKTGTRTAENSRKTVLSRYWVTNKNFRKIFILQHCARRSRDTRCRNRPWPSLRRKGLASYANQNRQVIDGLFLKGIMFGQRS
jgi:hypothetical protein